MQPYVLPLDTPQVTLADVGGKAAHLSRLARGGFRVPPGFVLTTAAYQQFVAANDLGARIAALGQAAASGEPAACETASAAIRALFEQGTVPADIAAAVCDAYRALAADEYGADRAAAVAVRSSATAEDLPQASFAGQQETYLNVRGEAAVLEAVKRCWASLWTARAIAYRARQGIDPAGVALAVVVQQLVPADVAGVLFTVNPLSGAADRVLINAAWGLGEAVVSGQVTPDTVVVDKASGAVLQAEVGDKALMTATTADGTAAVPVDADRRRAPALTREQAATLARLGQEIEAQLGGPQDVEWAIAAGTAYVLQARPVTALGSAGPRPATGAEVPPGDDAWPAEGERPAQPFDLWTQSDMGERWPEPITPLTWSLQPQITFNYTLHALRDAPTPYLAHTQWAKRYFGRVYMNEGAMAKVCVEQYGFPLSFMSGAMGSSATEEQAGGSRCHYGRMLRSLPRVLPATVSRMRNEARYERLFPRIDRWVAAFRARDLNTASDAALWDELERVWLRRFEYAIKLHADASTTAMSAVPMLEGLLERWAGDRALAPRLLTSISDVRTAEIVPALWRLAQALRELGLAAVVLEQPPTVALATLRASDAARPVLHQLDAFLAEHGHRCRSEAEWLYPRWAEAPEQVLEAVASYLRAGDTLDPLAAEARQRAERAATLAAVERRLDVVRRTILRRILARTEHLVRLRDNGQHYLTKLGLPIRHLYAVLGERWAARGWLAQPDDVFFLAHGEVGHLVRAGDPAALGRLLPALVTARRQAYRYWFTVKAPEVVDREGRPVATTPVDATALCGIPCSGGVAEGRARVVPTLGDAARVQPGEILVTRSTDPGWTPVFPLVAGLVLEVGGQLSHGAVVAREYGIPAVLNVRDAMQRIRDGQLLVVDGTAGRVYPKETPLPMPEAAPEARERVALTAL